MVEEQLQHGTGVGVIVSPRDLAMQNAVTYSQVYHGLGAHVLIDQQFYEPSFLHPKLASYPINEYRTTVSQLRQIRDDQLAGLASSLEEINRNVAADGVIAPALVYQAGRPDIAEVNARLFGLAKQVGDSLGVPTYATVVLERASASSLDTVNALLSQATALDADGWYFAFEFEPERVPSPSDSVYRCCAAGLTLACTGRPVLHAYAGLTALLSLGFGATGAAIGHSQNLWSFTRARWQPPIGQGGGGDAPPRFFSSTLWGTIIYPDEMLQLPPDLAERVLTLSPFSQPVGGGLPWSRWNANKHLIHEIISTISGMLVADDPLTSVASAIARLTEAVQLHNEIAEAGVFVRDDTNVYQRNWIDALDNLLRTNDEDYAYLSMIR